MPHRSSLLAPRRPVASVILFLSIGLAACGGGGGGTPEVTAPPRDAAALAVSQPGELLDYVRARLRTRLASGAAAPVQTTAPGLVLTTAASGDLAVRSATTVQEPGIDEQDLVKSDGQLVYSLDTVSRDVNGQPAPRLNAHRLGAGGTLERTATLPIPVEAQSYPVLQGLYLSEATRRIAVVAENVGFIGLPCGPTVDCTAGLSLLPHPGTIRSEVLIDLADAGADGALRALPRVALSGRLVGTRLVGQTLVVVSSHAPALALDRLSGNASPADRDAALAALTTADLLPTLRRGQAAPQPLVRDTDCYLQAANASLAVELTTVSLFDLARPEADPVSRCLVGGSEAVYLSARGLYLATTRTVYATSGDSFVYPAEMRTDLHKFVLDSGVPAYRASGSVAGHLGWDRLRKPYRLSEHNGDLRVLSFTGQDGWAFPSDAGTRPASPATLTVLRERTADASLQPVGQLPNPQRPEPIGKPGEQVYGVRFLGDRAYVVTFRVTDPLYVLDLADPADPKRAGELELPGYSDTLLPLPDGLLLGVGRTADAQGFLGGVQVSLFDVRDPARPALLGSEVFGGRGSLSGLDMSPQGINLRVAGAQVRVALPLWLSAGAPPQNSKGLQRIEVDLAARRLVRLPLIEQPISDGGFELWSMRSLQVGERLVLLSQGGLTSRAWAD